LTVDTSLTPQTASQKGLVWIKDTLYSPTAPGIAKEVEDLASKGYCLGKPGNPTSSTILVGLYASKGK
jgi:hypothetical protein